MDVLKLNIDSIKNINTSSIEIPLERGVYALVGSNGCGKSTILLCLAQLISTHYLDTLKKEDYIANSSIKFQYNGQSNTWIKNRSRWGSLSFPHIKFNGLYEGSLFYGTRFNDSRAIDLLLANGKILPEDIVDSDDYIKDKLSFILHGDYSHYRSLKKIRNKHITQKIGVSNTPYFNSVKNNLISQYRMSSGECLLISLLHFVYNAIVRKSLPRDQKILVLIDEIELALHPMAVSRLLDLLNELVSQHPNLVVLLTSHSPEVIRKIKPSNLYKVNNIDGTLFLESNCYPSYLIRDVYRHDGFDYLLLVEDNLTKVIVEKILNQEKLTTGKLVHVVPVGGWNNVLKLHTELLRWNVLGLGKQIASVLDGDIVEEVNADLKDIKKIFLPIKSVEKFLYQVIVTSPNLKIRKILNDKYFTISSLDTLLNEHKVRYPIAPDNPDKKFYFRLQKDLERRGISEEIFLINLCDDLLENIDFSHFKNSLRRLLV